MKLRDWKLCFFLDARILAKDAMSSTLKGLQDLLLGLDQSTYLAFNFKAPQSTTLSSLLSLTTYLLTSIIPLSTSQRSPHLPECLRFFFECLNLLSYHPVINQHVSVEGRMSAPFSPFFKASSSSATASSFSSSPKSCLRIGIHQRRSEW